MATHFPTVPVWFNSWLLPVSEKLENNKSSVRSVLKAVRLWLSETMISWELYLGIGFPVFLWLTLLFILWCGRVKQPVIAMNPTPIMLAKTEDLIFRV